MFKLFKTVNLLAALSLFLISGCATLPKDFERPESYAYTDTANTSGKLNIVILQMNWRRLSS